jgi:hypothetical protein
MATIYRADSPVARCRVCGVHRQFHTAGDVPHSADRDHAFEAEMVADFEPCDLTPAQLVAEIVEADGRLTRATRTHACLVELRARILKDMGVSWDDLLEALA